MRSEEQSSDGERLSSFLLLEMDEEVNAPENKTPGEAKEPKEFPCKNYLIGYSDGRIFYCPAGRLFTVYPSRN